MAIPKQPQTNPRKLSPLSERCQKLTHLRKLVSRISLYSKLALALALALVLLDSEDGLKILAGGEWGLFPVVASLRMTLALPPSTGTERKKIFQFEHKIFHQCCQLIDAGFMFHVKHLSMYILEYFVFWHVSCRRAWYLAHVKNDITYFSSTIIAKSSTVLSIRNLLFLFRFFQFCRICSTFFASA